MKLQGTKKCELAMFWAAVVVGGNRVSISIGRKKQDHKPRLSATTKM